MKVLKYLAPAIMVVFLVMFTAPAFACTNAIHSTHKIPFTLTAYLVGYTPGETSIKGDIIYTKGGAVTWIMLDGTLVSESKSVYSIFNTATGKGNGLSAYVDTYTNGLIGTGVIKGISASKTTVADGSVGTVSIVGYGSSDRYSHITEISTGSWHPTDTPFPTLTLTVTGVFIVQE